MSNVDLQGKHWTTFGTKGSGKSYLNDQILQRAANRGRRVVVFDPMDEYSDHENILRIVPTVKRGDEAREQLQGTIDRVEQMQDEVDYFVVDEISRFHSKGGQLDGPLGELVDLCRHWGIGIGFIARRPTQVHTDIREMSDYLFLFRLPGANDKRNLDGIADGLHAEMETLIHDYPDHHYILVDRDRNYRIVSPIQARKA